MANLQDYYSTGAGNTANNPAPGMSEANQKMSSPASAGKLAKNVVVAWGIMFGSLTLANYLIRKFG